MTEQTTDELLSRWAKDAQSRIPELELELACLNERVSSVMQKMMTFKNVIAAASGNGTATELAPEKPMVVSEKQSGTKKRVPRGQIALQVKAILSKKKGLTVAELAEHIHNEFPATYQRATLYVHLHRGAKAGEYVTSDGKWSLHS